MEVLEKTGLDAQSFYRGGGRGGGEGGGWRGAGWSLLRHFFVSPTVFPTRPLQFASALGVCTLLLWWRCIGSGYDGVGLLRCHVQGGGFDWRVGEGGGGGLLVIHEPEGGSVERKWPTRSSIYPLLAQVQACGMTNELDGYGTERGYKVRLG